MDELTQLITKAFQVAYADLADLLDVEEDKSVVRKPYLQPSNNLKFGHYQISNVMQISKLIKQKNLQYVSTPNELGKKLVEALNADKQGIIKEAALASIYVNITLTDAFLTKAAIAKFMTGPEARPEPPKHETQTVCVDFSSPNIAKSMHVGHLRSTIIGESISRIFEYLGHKVYRMNHLGDWGTQFGMLIAHLLDRDMTDTAHELPIADLVEFYKEAKQKFDNDKDFQTRAKEEVVKLQREDELECKLWQRLCDVSRKEFQRIYDQLDITLQECGESFYRKELPGIVQELTDHGLVQESQGAKIIDVGLTYPLIVQKSDGGYTYDTTDMATIKYRTQVLKCNRIIYVVDLGQGSHFDLVFEAAKRMNWLTNSSPEFCGFGVVVGEDGKKLKTRAGETVKLQDLIDEAVKQAGEQIKLNGKGQKYSDEEIKNISEAVGISAIKYADMCSQRTKDYRFSYEKMLNFKGNTASYMLYSYARISNIVRKAEIKREDLYLKKHLDNFTISEAPERVILLTLLKFDSVINEVAKDLMPHHICEWMYSLSGNFTEFYEKCRVIQTDGTVNISRMILCEMVRKALDISFHLLGLKAIDRM